MASEVMDNPINPTFNHASLYIGDLEPSVNESILFQIFNTIGPIASIRLCRDSTTRRSLGYGYLNFHSAADAERAIDTMNYTSIHGRQCRIMFSQRDPSILKIKNDMINATGSLNLKVKLLYASTSEVFSKTNLLERPPNFLLEMLKFSKDLENINIKIKKGMHYLKNVNQSFLIFHSPVFKSMLLENKKEELEVLGGSGFKIIEINDLSEEEISAMLNFINTGEIPDDIKMMMKLLISAYRYKIMYLSKTVQYELGSRIDEENVCDILNLCCKLSYPINDIKLDGLIELVVEYIILNDVCNKKKEEIKKIIVEFPEIAVKMLSF